MDPLSLTPAFGKVIGTSLSVIRLHLLLERLDTGIDRAHKKFITVAIELIFVGELTLSLDPVLQACC
jgi:hypothetical protein